MRSFGLDLEKSTDSNVQNVIQKWLDVEYTLSLAAVSYTLDDDDGLFHWYNDGKGKPYPHNFYIYEEPSEKKLYLIPWILITC
jgi:spore coat protein CotH